MTPASEPRTPANAARAALEESIVLPDFIIIGAMKCGTTSLFQHLGQHPEIGLSRDKETDFFLAESNFSRGFRWYSAQYRPGARVYGEASPNYTKCNEFPGVAERIFMTVPEAKLIYMVRNPVERFVSQYLHHMNACEIDIPPERLLQTPAGMHYLDCSRYFRQVSEYLRYFPQERLFVACLDELSREPERLLRRVFSFLDVDADAPLGDLTQAHNRRADLQRLPSWYFTARRSALLRGLKQRLPSGLQRALHNQVVSRSRRRLPEVGDSLKAEVKALLADDAARFRALTGRDFAHWSI